MIPNHNHSPANSLVRISLCLCATVVVLSMTLVSGTDVANEKSVASVPAIGASASLAMDAAVFGSSTGQASIKSAPTTWSSRSTVRWNARWTTDARYVV